MFSKVRGRFARWTASLVYDQADPTRSSALATIEAASVDTHDTLRDAYLKSHEFFDVARYPHITFRSNRVEPAGKDRLRVTGDLTIRGVSRELTLDVAKQGSGTDAQGKPKVGFLARSSISRSDWGLKWSQALEAGGVLVAEKVDIELDIQAVEATG
jgi:polyisoprenoid-binding protein YceI